MQSRRLQSVIVGIAITLQAARVYVASEIQGYFKTSIFAVERWRILNRNAFRKSRADLVGRILSCRDGITAHECKSEIEKGSAHGYFVTPGSQLCLRIRQN